MDRFAEVCEQIASQGDPIRKARLMSDYLNSLASEERRSRRNFSRFAANRWWAELRYAMHS